MKTVRDCLIYYALKYNGDWEKIYQAIRNKETIDWDLYETYPQNLRECAVAYSDPEYPEILKEVFHPPFVLFSKGNKELLLKDKVSIIGTRQISEYGIEATKMVVDSVYEDFVVVSGMALGVDGCAHRETIAKGGETIAVLACSIDEIYPSENEDLYYELCLNHLVISERAFKGFTRDDFPTRNRIIVGLSKALIVPEAYHRSGSTVSINLAIANNRDVLCVPQPFYTNSANNFFINEGAFMVQNKKEIMEILKKNK